MKFKRMVPLSSRQSFYEMNFWDWDYMAYPMEGQAHITLLEGKAGEAARLFDESRNLFQGLPNTLSPTERKEWFEISEQLSAATQP